MLCRIRNTLENLNILELKTILLIGLFVVNYGPNSYLLRTLTILQIGKMTKNCQNWMTSPRVLQHMVQGFHRKFLFWKLM